MPGPDLWCGCVLSLCSWLQDQLPPEVLKRCYFFNTFFFKKLVEDQGEGCTRFCVVVCSG